MWNLILVHFTSWLYKGSRSRLYKGSVQGPLSMYTYFNVYENCDSAVSYFWIVKFTFPAINNMCIIGHKYGGPVPIILVVIFIKYHWIWTMGLYKDAHNWCYGIQWVKHRVNDLTNEYSPSSFLSPTVFPPCHLSYHVLSVPTCPFRSPAIITSTLPGMRLIILSSWFQNSSFLSAVHPYFGA